MASIQTRDVRNRRRYDVRWRDDDGKQRMKTFGNRRDAELFARHVEQLDRFARIEHDLRRALTGVELTGEQAMRLVDIIDAALDGESAA